MHVLQPHIILAGANPQLQRQQKLQSLGNEHVTWLPMRTGMACNTSQQEGGVLSCFVNPHLQLVQVANVELWDGSGPAAHANDLGLWGILGQQHFPEVLVHLQQGTVH